MRFRTGAIERMSSYDNEREKYRPTDEGREAYHDGLLMSDCPYDQDSEEAVEWEGGWMEAEEEDAD